MLIILGLMALLAVYSNIQRFRREKVETVIVMPATSPAAPTPWFFLARARFFALLNNKNQWGSNPDMKKLFGLPMIICLAIFCSCQKQQTEEERKTEIERQVQERLASERQAQNEQQL